MTKHMRGNLLLLLAAFIWGVAFVAQSEGMKYVGPFTFIGIRSFLGGFALLIFLGVRNLCAQKKRGITEGSPATEEKKSFSRKDLFLGGLCCGLVLFTASTLQQIGIQYTPESGKAGFITALYIVLVPLCGVFRKKKIGWHVWLAVLVALVGMYLLCITDGFSIAKGDIYLILCAVAFTGHILVIDHFSPKTDGVAMSCIQFFVCGILGTAGMLLTEQVELSQVIKAWLPLVYAGVLSSGVAYTLQIVAQKDTEPTVASLLMSLESVFAVLGGFVILGQKLSVRELFGCGFMFAAILLAQVVHSEKVCYDKKVQKKSDGIGG
ncbi:MAG: DMT family transporter [Lachnospiraceae bacterium]|nr:DMT family transporter [Lachnospiraceae bacterium]